MLIEAAQVLTTFHRAGLYLYKAIIANKQYCIISKDTSFGIQNLMLQYGKAAKNIDKHV